MIIRQQHQMSKQKTVSTSIFHSDDRTFHHMGYLKGLLDKVVIGYKYRKYDIKKDVRILNAFFYDSSVAALSVR